jgi:hypothetical protein
LHSATRLLVVAAATRHLSPNATRLIVVSFSFTYAASTPAKKFQPIPIDVSGCLATVVVVVLLTRSHNLMRFTAYFCHVAEISL